MRVAGKQKAIPKSKMGFWISKLWESSIGNFFHHKVRFDGLSGRFPIVDELTFNNNRLERFYRIEVGSYFYPWSLIYAHRLSHCLQLKSVNNGDCYSSHYDDELKQKPGIIGYEIKKRFHGWLLTARVIISFALALFFSGWFLIFSGRYGGSPRVLLCLLSFLLAFVFTAHAISRLLE
jgi:hypothetical protein